MNPGDVLYLINNNGEGLVKASAVVKGVFNSEKMSKEESENLVQGNQDKLQLTDKQFAKWAGKRYVVMIQVENVTVINPFPIDKSAYGNMDDWIPVGDINKIKM